MTDIAWRWLGQVPYGEALERQRCHRAGVIAGERQEELWLLEHEPVVTTGRRNIPDLPASDTLEEAGIALHQTERGGLATYHGPGQLVAYAIVDCWERGLGAKGTVHALEEGVIRWLKQYDITATRRPGYPGVWAGMDKICAVGMHFRRGVSMHGIALNLGVDLTAFSLITPCGISDGGVTSLKSLLGSAPSPAEAAPGLASNLIDCLHQPVCGVQQLRSLRVG